MSIDNRVKFYIASIQGSWWRLTLTSLSSSSQFSLYFVGKLNNKIKVRTTVHSLVSLYFMFA
jgi:hypothetical protein